MRNNYVIQVTEQMNSSVVSPEDLPVRKISGVESWDAPHLVASLWSQQYPREVLGLLLYSHKMDMLADSSLSFVYVNTYNFCSVAVLGKNIWGPGPSSFGRQQRLSEIIEPIKNLGGLGKIWGCCAPWPQHRTPTVSAIISNRCRNTWHVLYSSVFMESAAEPTQSSHKHLE